MEREGIHGSALCVSMLRSCQACDGWLTSLCSNSPLNSPPPCFCKFVKVVSTEHHKKEETRCSSALKSRQYSKIIFICARKYGSLMFLSSADVHIFHSELIPSLPSYIFPLCSYSTHMFCLSQSRQTPSLQNIPFNRLFTTVFKRDSHIE